MSVGVGVWKFACACALAWVCVCVRVGVCVGAGAGVGAGVWGCRGGRVREGVVLGFRCQIQRIPPRVCQKSIHPDISNVAFFNQSDLEGPQRHHAESASGPPDWQLGGLAA